MLFKVLYKEAQAPTRTNRKSAAQERTTQREVMDRYRENQLLHMLWLGCCWACREALLR